MESKSIAGNGSSQPGGSKTAAPESKRQRAAAKHFQLVRYFSLASLVMFALVALALTYFEGQQSGFFKQVQKEESDFLKKVQDDFSNRQDAAARRDLLTIHEAGNVNLTRLFANALWEKDFAPFVTKAQDIQVDHCRAIADVKDEKDGKLKPPPEKKACFSEVGRKIMAIKGFADLNGKVYDSMKKSTVFKIKVYDLRGITVYSSENAQIGEDKADNAGWIGAAKEGKPKSELVFRDKFSAFEGTVEKRDLIQSYLPVLQPGSDRIVSVFEVYSDVTPFLDQIKKTAAGIKQTAADNQAKVEQASAANEGKVEDFSTQTLIIVLALMLALFGALFVIVHRADGIIARQETEQQQAQQQLAQAEKMASLGQMVAGVAHQLNTPLAFTHSNVSMAMQALDGYEKPLKLAAGISALVRNAGADQLTVNLEPLKAQASGIEESDLDASMPKEMLSDTLQGIEQMRELVENLRDFTRLDRNKTARFDLNKGLHNVIYIAKSVIPPRILVVEEFGQIPMIECNVSQINQVFLNLVNNAAQAIAGDGTITVRSSMEGRRVRVEVTDTGSGIPADALPHIWENYFTTKASGDGTGLGLPVAKTIVEEHGGEILVTMTSAAGTTFAVLLPAGADELQGSIES